jgi:hypothetical protein
MKTKTIWSDWIEWPLERDPLAVPDIRPGVLIEADLMLRPELIYLKPDWSENARADGRPDLTRATFVSCDCYSFQLKFDPSVHITHMVVGRYRHQVEIAEQETETERELEIA